jgi:hypothetical protein
MRPFDAAPGPLVGAAVLELLEGEAVVCVGVLEVADGAALHPARKLVAVSAASKTEMRLARAAGGTAAPLDVDTV